MTLCQPFSSSRTLLTWLAYSHHLWFSRETPYNCSIYSSNNYIQLSYSSSQPGALLPLTPRGHLAISGDILGYHNWGQYYCHLMSRGHTCCWHPPVDRRAPTTKGYPTRRAGSAQVENHALSHHPAVFFLPLFLIWKGLLFFLLILLCLSPHMRTDPPEKHTFDLLFH